MYIHNMLIKLLYYIISGREAAHRRGRRRERHGHVSILQYISYAIMLWHSIVYHIIPYHSIMSSYS